MDPDASELDGMGYTEVEVVKVLLDEKMEANAQSKDGWTALQCAAQNGHLDTRKWRSYC